MRVLFCSRRYFPAVSGMSVYAHNLLRELVAHGHDVTMLSQYRSDAAGTRIYGGGPPPPLAGVKVIGRRSLGEEQGGDFERDIEDMLQVVRAEHALRPFDILHAQYGYPNGWTVLRAARELGVPCVVSIQGGDGHWVGSCCETHRLGMRRVLQHAGAVLIGGESFAAEVVHRLDVPRSMFTIVPGAVDVHRFAPEPERRSGEPLRLLYHGRVDRRKGSLDFIEALALLRGRGVRFAATVSGIGPDLEPTRERVAALRLDDAVRFTGAADYETAPSVYRQQDLFVSPTYAEGFSNTVLEAMASGLAIVSCAVVGIRDCLRDGENALLVEPADIAAQAAALQRLIEDAPVDAHDRAASALNMPTALALSPHLDDAAFSCGGLLAACADAGWRVVVATLFTRSVAAPTGFALACQLDKGLGAEVDYMALRREEDRAACAELGALPCWLDFAEAPHRGYGSAASLFAAPHPDDGVETALRPAILGLIEQHRPDLLLAPQCIGGHVDHVLTARTLQATGTAAPVLWWRDFPYAMRPDRAVAAPFASRLDDLPERRARFDVPRKRRACAAYQTQLGFQFGGRDGLDRMIAASDGAECFRVQGEPAWAGLPELGA